MAAFGRQLWYFQDAFASLNLENHALLKSDLGRDRAFSSSKFTFNDSDNVQLFDEFKTAPTIKSFARACLKLKPVSERLRCSDFVLEFKMKRGALTARRNIRSAQTAPS